MLIITNSCYTPLFYRGSQDGKTCRFTWKSFTSNSWGKSETGLPGQQMQKNWPWISYMEVAHQICQWHIHHGSVKTETKNPYVEVTWGSRHQVGNFYVNMFSPDVEYILLGRSLKPPDWPPHHFFSLYLSSHPCHVRAIEDATFRNQWCPIGAR